MRRSVLEPGVLIAFWGLENTAGSAAKEAVDDVGHIVSAGLYAAA